MDTKILKEIFKAKKEKTDRKGRLIAGFKETSVDQFLNWFNLESFKKGCYYCRTTNEQSLHLYNLQRKGLRPDATKGGKRERRLEIDRKDPFKPYDNLENIVWCCYWCNNAKSNFFTESEFKPIALAIGNVVKEIYRNSTGDKENING